MLKRLWQKIKSIFSKPKVTTPPPVPVSPTPEAPTTPVEHPGDSRNPNWYRLWETCEIDTERLQEVLRVCKKILNYRDKYDYVELHTGVPWFMVAALHYRESSLNFNTYLHNGQPLGRVTTIVPKGIYFPKGEWKSAAVDALVREGFHKVRFKDIPTCLMRCERYNGLGYRSKGEYSPYVWAGTNHHDETGKYVADGRYSATAPEKQLGTAAIIKGLLMLVNQDTRLP